MPSAPQDNVGAITVFVRALLLTTALFGGLGACATPVTDQHWIRLRSEHFQGISSADAETTRAITRELERFRQIVISVTELEDIQPTLPTTVYLFGDARTFTRFRPRSNVEGFMVPALHRNFLTINASEEKRAIPIAFHEYVHFVLRNASNVTYPAWYDEGFAEFLSSVRVAERRVQLGDVPHGRADWLVYGNLLSLRRMLSATDILSWSDRALAMFYAQSWALTHFLHHGHFQGHRQWHKGLADYLWAVHRGEDPEQAVESAFGSDVEELERGLVQYIRTGKIPIVPHPLEDTSSDGWVELAPLDKPDQLYLLADLALHSSQRHVSTAQQLLESALVADPDHAKACATLGRLLVSTDPVKAGALVDRALELRSADPEVHRLAGDALLARASASSAGSRSARSQLIDSARSHYETSLDLDPTQAASHVGLARIQGQRDPSAAIRSLEAARAPAPGYSPLNLELAELYLKADRTAEARDLLRRVNSQPHDEALREVDQRRIERLIRDSGIATQGGRSTRHLTARLELETPEEGQVITGPLPLTELFGSAGLFETTLHDVVIALDESNSTLTKLHRDIDGDGSNDSIIEAELAAAYRLVGRLDPRTTRVALVTFTASARVLVPLGPPSAVLAALDAYEIKFDPTGTSHAIALAVSLQELVDHADPDARRKRSVLLLSDGRPTAPSVPVASRDALRIARFYGEHGIRIHAFALGPLRTAETYREIAEVSLGSYVSLEDPGDIVARLAEVRLSGLEAVEIRNQTNQTAARAVRVFPDGSFDGFLELQDGRNEIEVLATIQDREPIIQQVTLHYMPDALETAEHEATLEEFRERLRERSVETELYRETQRTPPSASPDGDLSIEIDED